MMIFVSISVTLLPAHLHVCQAVILHRMHTEGALSHYSYFCCEQNDRIFLVRNITEYNTHVLKLAIFQPVTVCTWAYLPSVVVWKSGLMNIVISHSDDAFLL